jgi:NADH-quinone oxidoreductase subunit G
LALGEEGLADYGALPDVDANAKAEGTMEAYPIKDFYLTNPIARASVVLAECSALAKARAETPVAAE